MTLPPLEEWSGSAADWPSYLDGVYDLFMRTFVRANHQFLGKPVRARWNPPHDNKHFSFWHVVSEKGQTDSEDDRNIDIHRCERVAWIGHVLSMADDDAQVLYWCNERAGKRGRQQRHLLYLHRERYLVILGEKEDCFHLVTAYCVEYDHTHGRLMKEKEEWDRLQGR